MENDNLHLDVYKNHSELHNNGTVTFFEEGPQNEDTLARYQYICNAFKGGFYESVMKDLSVELYNEKLTPEQQNMIKGLVDGLTSEVGRAIVGLTCLQLAIKSIKIDQSIRLHKGGSNRRNGFSWREGISMRSLDSMFNTPFLREFGLLNINKDGIMMTRSLAENYPYSQLYKAEIRGPVKNWIDIVEALENKSLLPYPGLCYLLSLLKNRSDSFKSKVVTVVNLAKEMQEFKFETIKTILISFFNNAEYSARAFEVVIHCFMQALSEQKLIDGELVPLSQMRSANKKHGNIGDIEVKRGNMIIESWDAKYGKPYLRDELEELNDKLYNHPNVEIAGFIVNSQVDLRQDIKNRVQEIGDLHKCEILLLTIDEWIEKKTSKMPSNVLDTLGYNWIIAVAESFGQKRTTIAPIDEPCEVWIDELLNHIQEAKQ